MPNYQYGLTAAELERIVAFINGEDDDFVNSGIAEKVFRISKDIQTMTMKVLSRKISEVGKLETRLNRLREKEEQRAADGHFSDLAIPTEDLARMIVYYMQQDGGRVTWNRVNYHLFFLYATFLVKFKERLTVDMPKAQEWGPQFWTLHSAFRKGLVDPRIRYGSAVVESVAKVSTAVPAIAKNHIAYLRDFSDEDLQTILTKRNEPWLAAVERARKNSPEGQTRWGEVLDDGAIYVWKRNFSLKDSD